MRKNVSSWLRQQVVIVSDSQNLTMMTKEMLKSYGWGVVESTPHVERAVATVRQGLACMIILDDSANAPVSQKLRYLITDQNAVLTPVLALVSPNNLDEVPAMKRMGRPQIVEKPMTPSKVIPAFVELVKFWENDVFAAVRRANYNLINGNEALGLKILFKLRNIDHARHFAAQSLSIYLRRIGKIKESEMLLLETLKKSPRELGIMMALGSHYLHFAMPALALRLFQGARSAFGNANVIYPDLIQASLSCNQFDQAIDYLFHLHRKEYLPNETKAFLSRLLYVEGRQSELNSVLAHNKSYISKMHAAWVEADTEQPSLAS